MSSEAAYAFDACSIVNHAPLHERLAHTVDGTCAASGNTVSDSVGDCPPEPPEIGDSSACSTGKFAGRPVPATNDSPAPSPLHRVHNDASGKQQTIPSSLSGRAQILRTDREGQFLNNEMQSMLQSSGVKHETPAARTPEQKGIARLGHGNIYGMMQTILLRCLAYILIPSQGQLKLIPGLKRV